MTDRKTSRNDPCPCGSGKKYKQCCLTADAVRAATDRPDPQALAAALQAAVADFEAGRLQAADAACQRVLQLAPKHPDALHLQAMIAHRIGMDDVAAVLLRTVLEIAPKFADGHNNLGVVLMALHQPNEAIASYRKAIALQADHANAHYNLGNALKAQGRLREAVASYQKALLSTPDYAQLHSNLGDALQALGSLPEAIARYRRALALQADLPEVHYNLGDALVEQQDFAAAAASYEAAIAHRPDYAEAHNNLGALLQKLGRPDDAIVRYRAAISLKPDYAQAHSNLGSALLALRQLDQAVTALRLAITLDPDAAEACNNLGSGLLELGQLDEASRWVARALALQPDYAEAHSNLGNVRQAQGRLDEAVACYRRALTLKPGASKAYSNLLYTMQYMSTVAPAELFDEQLRYAERYETPLKAHWQPHANRRDPARRLKLGYVSADFRNHSVAFFIEPILASHDRSQFEVYCYYNHNQRDAWTAQIAAHADHWRVVAGLDDEQLAQRIRADGIDLLIDLSGHTGDNRLPTFARKPAPVQATWIGYAGSTGLGAMDYRISNAEMDPPGLTERYHSETLLRLPDSGVSYRPEADCPAVNSLPALAGEGFVFASLNNLTKTNPAVVALWASILQALPHARLMLGNVSDDSTRQGVIEQFGRVGVDAARLLLLPRLSFRDYLALHHQIDLALDPYPYNGGTTTMHSLWMGVPVLTLAGANTVSRVGVSALTSVGLDSFIASSEDAYRQRAIEATRDLPALNAIRRSLRERMAASNRGPAAITRHLEAAYREMWQRYCAG